MKEIVTKAEIDNFFNSFNNMIQDLIICCENIEIITKKYHHNEKSKVIDNFLYHYITLAYSFSTITLSKLFIKEEKRSFKKFLNKLENCDYDLELKTLLIKNTKDFQNGDVGEYDDLFKNKNEIKEEIKITRQLINDAESLIQKIKSRRDSYYAHYDPDKNQNIEVESLEEIKILLDLSQKIYNRYFAGLKNSTFIFNVPMELDELFENL